MLSRRRVLTSLTATGVALVTQRVPTVADARRVIVYSQIHIWPANTPERPWVAGTRPQLPEPFTIERVIPMLDEAGVDRVASKPITGTGRRDAGEPLAEKNSPSPRTCTTHDFAPSAVAALKKAEEGERLSSDPNMAKQSRDPFPAVAFLRI